MLPLVIAAGLVVAAAVGLSVEHRNSAWVPSGRSLDVTFYTAVLAYGVLRSHRPHWSRLTFWLTLAVLLSIHFAVYAAAFRAITEWRIVWCAPLFMVEYTVFLAALEALGYGSGGR